MLPEKVGVQGFPSLLSLNLAYLEVQMRERRKKSGATEFTNLLTSFYLFSRRYQSASHVQVIRFHRTLFIVLIVGDTDLVPKQGFEKCTFDGAAGCRQYRSFLSGFGW